jgi:hypothetical protein
MGLKDLIMTYTFKLARRLAATREFGMLPLLLLLGACAADETSAPNLPSDNVPAATAAPIRLSPRRITVKVGQPVRFRALGGGGALPVGVTWTATGGNIQPDGTFLSSMAGTFKVTGRGRGRNTRSDTSVVVVVGPTPTVTAVVVSPGSSSLASGTAITFKADAQLSDGSTKSAAVKWTANGGSITTAGLFTAGTSAGTFRVVALDTLADLADTAAVTVQVSDPEPAPTPTPTPSGNGIAFGTFHLPDDQYGVRSYSGALRAIEPSYAESNLAAAASKGIRLVVSLPGSRGNYTNADGTFNLTLWKQRMDRWRSYASVLDRYYQSGTIVGNYLVDEPHCSGCWGGKTIAYADIEEMGRYAKSFLPNLPTMVRTHPGWLRSSGRTFPSIDAAWAQYEGPLHYPSANMTPEQFRDKNVADAKALGMKLVFGLNVLDGGDGSSGITGAMNVSTRWVMSAAEVEHAGTVFAAEPYACSVMDWRFSLTYTSSRLTSSQLSAIQKFDDRSDVKTALSKVAGVAKNHASASCK